MEINHHKNQIDWFQLVIKFADLYRRNITNIVPECFNRHVSSLASVPQRMLNEPRTCIFSPLDQIKVNFMGSVVDVEGVLSSVKNYVEHIRSVEIFHALVQLIAEERMFLMDFSAHVELLTNATATVILLPLCLMNEALDTVTDFEREVNNTLLCVKEELAKADLC